MSNNQNEYDYLLKYLIIGNSGVGKSCLLLRYSDDEYSDKHIITIGVDFKIKSLNIDGYKVKTNIWDTAGQERFKNITVSYYKGASGVMLVYDITDIESFNKLSDWLIEVEKNAPNNVYKILIGNKADLSDQRQVSYDQGKVSHYIRITHTIYDYDKFSILLILVIYKFYHILFSLSL